MRWWLVNQNNRFFSQESRFPIGNSSGQECWIELIESDKRVYMTTGHSLNQSSDTNILILILSLRYPLTSKTLLPLLWPVTHGWGIRGKTNERTNRISRQEEVANRWSWTHSKGDGDDTWIRYSQFHLSTNYIKVRKGIRGFCLGEKKSRMKWPKRFLTMF